MSHNKLHSCITTNNYKAHASTCTLRSTWRGKWGQEVGIHGDHHSDIS